MKIVTILTILFFAFSLHAISLSLEEAEQIAISNNLELKKEDLSKKAVLWEKWDAIAQYLPSLSINTTHLRLDDDTFRRANAFTNIGGDGSVPAMPPDLYVDYYMDTTSLAPAGRTVLENPYVALGNMFANIPMDPTYQNSWETKLQVNQKITNGLKELVAIFQMAPSKVGLIYGTYNLTKEQIILQTRKAYYNLIKLKESVLMFNSIVESSEKAYSKTKTQFNAGQLSEDILLTQEAQLLSDKAELMNMQNLYNVTKEMFQDIIGKKIDSEITTDPLSKFEAKFSENILEDGSIENNSELLIAKSAYGMANAGKNIVLTNSLPNINMAFTRSWLADTTISPMDSRPNNTFAILFNWNLGVSNFTSSKKSIYDAKKAELDVKIKERDLKTRLKIKKESLSYKKDKAQAMLKASNAQSRSFSIMQKRYEAGLINNIDLINLSLLYKQKKIAYLEALFGYLEEIDSYYQLIGKLGDIK